MTPTKDLMKTKQDIETISTPILSKIFTLQVKDEAGYAVADYYLGRIREARKTIKAKFSTFIDPLKESVKKAKEALDQANKFMFELDEPLEEGEIKVKALLHDFTVKRLAEERAEENRRQAEQAELNMQAQIAYTKEQAAKTEAMRKRLATQRVDLEAKAAEVEAVPVAQPVKVSNSSVRTKKVCHVVKKRDLMAAALDPQSPVPLEIFRVDQLMLNAWFKQRPDFVAQWPGISIEDDVTIVGR